MSKFEVLVVEVSAIEPIEGADRIEVAVVGDYRSIVQKGAFKVGDLAAYIPEGSIVPQTLLEAMNLVGCLDGSNKDRVKAKKFKKVLSQGLLYWSPVMQVTFKLGDDVAEELGIVKWEPTIPVNMVGRVVYIPTNCASIGAGPIHYDIENFKKYPNILQDGELVEMTEKAHGTFCGIAVIPGLNNEQMFLSDGSGIVYSKGLGGKGLVFLNGPENKENTYVAMATKLGLHEKIAQIFPGKTVHVLGEIYGYHVQDLEYGMMNQKFACFDINIDGEYLNRWDLGRACTALDIPRCKVLYRGPFSKATMQEYTDGPTVMGNGAHMREGVVVVPVHERKHHNTARVIFKSVSEAYLLRKGETTEFN